jgi:hypothetical protein
LTASRPRTNFLIKKNNRKVVRSEGPHASEALSLSRDGFPGVTGGITLPAMANERCSWCGEDVEPDDGFRAYEPAGERRAVFCRLEHVVPWSIQGPHWEAGALDEPNLPLGQAVPGREAEEAASDVCSHCGEELGQISVLLVRHRGEHRIADAFCSSEHLFEWAKAGGRYAT